MRSTYTPGPWHVVEREGSMTGEVCLSVQQRISGDEDPEIEFKERWIVDLTERRITSAEEEELRANARLMAAAPELLEASKVFLAMYIRLAESGDCGNWNPEEEAEVIAVRAAIHKAEHAEPHTLATR